MVRVSFGLANTAADVDALVEGLSAIVAKRYCSAYSLDQREGIYRPAGWKPRLADFFTLQQDRI
jgi:hypothetical protein